MVFTTNYWSVGHRGSYHCTEGESQGLHSLHHGRSWRSSSCDLFWFYVFAWNSLSTFLDWPTIDHDWRGTGV
ncbi:MAG: hypothetical protein ACFE8V_05210 [Promethearchaeota archaeon]